MGWASGKRYLFNAIKYLSPLIHVGKMPQKQLPLKAVAPFRQRKKTPYASHVTCKCVIDPGRHLVSRLVAFGKVFQFSI